MLFFVSIQPTLLFLSMVRAGAIVKALPNGVALSLVSKGVGAMGSGNRSEFEWARSNAKWPFMYEDETPKSSSAGWGNCFATGMVALADQSAQSGVTP